MRTREVLELQPVRLARVPRPLVRAVATVVAVVASEWASIALAHLLGLA